MTAAAAARGHSPRLIYIWRKMFDDIKSRILSNYKGAAMAFERTAWSQLESIWACSLAWTNFKQNLKEQWEALVT
jgi:hypothetical protein